MFFVLIGVLFLLIVLSLPMARGGTPKAFFKATLLVGSRFF